VGCLDASYPATDTPCTDANVQIITASSYDQSCQQDSDCVGISEGNACEACVVACPGVAAINVSALGRYQADIAATYGDHETATCNCPAAAGSTPCCIAGMCAPGPQCSGDASSAADAGTVGDVASSS
jgi:hypothetical protein